MGASETDRALVAVAERMVRFVASAIVTGDRVYASPRSLEDIRMSEFEVHSRNDIQKCHEHCEIFSRLVSHFQRRDEHFYICQLI